MRLRGCIGVRKENQTASFGGSKSRNKVSVGEPAEGSSLKALYAYSTWVLAWILFVAGAPRKTAALALTGEQFTGLYRQVR